MNIDESTFGNIHAELIPGVTEWSEAEGFSLGDGTLALLGAIVRKFAIKKVFEFGSGRSTKEFLACGCEVFCVEDAERWLNETVKTVPKEHLERLRSTVLPLRTVWHRGVPMKGWNEEAIAPMLADADLVLIDSPSCPPYREYALILSLKYAKHAIIVVDDANIPTVERFCRRLAADRSRVLSCSAAREHGVFILARRSGAAEIECRRGLIEAAKAWRRFFSLGAPTA